MSAEQRVIRDEIVEVRRVVSVGPVDGQALGTFRWFIGVRARGGRDVTADRRRFGVCVICGRDFVDDDPVHMVLSVVRNGKTVGNRLCCTACSEQHASFRRGEVRGG